MQSALGFSCFSFGSFLYVLSTLSIITRKTRANRKPASSSAPTFDSERFQFEKNQEAYDKLNVFRSIWAERKVVLDELDGEIQRNFERRGWLPLMDISHPPPTTLIWEFYLNLSAHSDHSNTQYVMSWIRGVEYTITPSGVASALGVPLVRQPEGALRWDPSLGWHHVISYWVFYPVGFWSSDHLSRVDRDSLSLLDRKSVV